MEETVGSPAEINSKIYLNKKRKSEDEYLGMPLTKHVRWAQRLEHDSSSNSSIPLEEMDCNIVVMVHEPEAESTEDSTSIHADTDASMSIEAKTNQFYGKSFASDEPSTSSVSWSGASYRIAPYSLESRTLTKSNSVVSDSLSQSLYDHGYGSHPALNYEEHFQEFGTDADYCCSEYTNENIEHCADDECDDMLSANGNAPNYILSSGRWPVNEGTQQGAGNITIDKEFEQYFSTLMLPRSEGVNKKAKPQYQPLKLKEKDWRIP